MPDFDFDFFIIGAGSGGVRAARIAAQHGAKVGIAEADRFGGTCVIRGCVPKKLMVYASRFPHEFALAEAFGWDVRNPIFDFKKLVANKDKEIERLEQIYKSNLEKAGVSIFQAEATFEDAHRLKLSTGEYISAKTILIATGGTPVRPTFEGQEFAITSDGLFELSNQPKRLFVVGGGYIAIEFASLFAELGTDVTLLKRSGVLLRGFDEEMTALLVEALKDKINICGGCEIAHLEKHKNGFHITLTDGTEHEADQVLLATGRRPNVARLALEKAGVSLNDKGAIAVSKNSQTNIEHIYAVGDVTDRVALTPVAIREGHAVADSLFGHKPWHVDHEGLPSAAFTTPELAHVGLTEKQARAQFTNVKIFRSSFRPLREVMSPHAARVHLKLVVDEDTDIVLGAHMLGEGAGEMIQLLAIPIRMKATKADLYGTMAVHPTVAEEWVTLK